MPRSRTGKAAMAPLQNAPVSLVHGEPIVSLNPEAASTLQPLALKYNSVPPKSSCLWAISVVLN